MAEKKLRPKYMVFKINEEGETQQPSMLATNTDNVDSPFVLMPRKDPAAFYALLNYAQACEPDLGREIRVWLDKVVRASPAYGTQGERNRVCMRLRQMDLFQ